LSYGIESLSESKKNQPLVSVVIPHWRGTDILLRGLQALHEHSHHPLEIVLVDNGCDDGSIAVARQQFDDLKVVATGRNLGYAGGCNHGMRAAAGKYIVLFNNDAVPAPNWLAPMLALMESDATIAACQPKIIALEARDTFDYAGACGGYLDFLGFPFCRGRIVATLEKDEGQYDGAVEIFWASGGRNRFELAHAARRLSHCGGAGGRGLSSSRLDAQLDLSAENLFKSSQCAGAVAKERRWPPFDGDFATASAAGSDRVRTPAGDWKMAPRAHGGVRVF
jgi:glycosyltransferase involved in cell wall biosynthesis